MLNEYPSEDSDWLGFFLIQECDTIQQKDPFNLSNDEYYNPKLLDNTLRSTIGSSLIQVHIKLLHLVVCGYTLLLLQ